MKKPTPLQQLIEALNERMSLFPNEDNLSLSERGLYDGYLNAKRAATELLAAEKQEIETSFADGFVEGYATGKSGEQRLFPEQYFNDTYQTNL